MFVQSKMTKTGAATAFVSNTLKELPERSFDFSYNGSEKFTFVKTYEMDAFWTTSRNNGKMGLAFGKYTFRFTTQHDTERIKYANLTYADILNVAQPAAKRFLVVLDQPVAFEAYPVAKIIWDGSSMWDSGFNKDGSLITVVLPQLIAAYAQLPTPPAGSDGWYKLLKPTE